MLQEKFNLSHVNYNFPLSPADLEMIKGSKHLYCVIVSRELRSGLWIAFLLQLLAPIENYTFQNCLAMSVDIS
jgi:hypothetical protein